MSTNNICFHGEIRKLFFLYPLLSGAMVIRHYDLSLWIYMYNEKKKTIALDKVLFSTKKYLYFSYFSTKTYVVGTH